jgi:hypothetical protein
MKPFIITAHIEFGGKLKRNPDQPPIRTGLIRMEIKAESEDEARSMANTFIQAKTTIIVDSCEPKPAEEAKFDDGDFKDAFQKFRDLFGGKGK